MAVVYLLKPQTGVDGMPQQPDIPLTSILLIDPSKFQRAYWTDQLKRCSTFYEILEASDGQSGMDLYRTRRINCVVLELAMPDDSGFPTLIQLVPIASRPQVPVIVLTEIPYPAVWEVAKQNGAFACLAKKVTTGEELDGTIQRAIAFVGQMPKEERFPPI